MHIEKNMFDDIFNMIMDVKRKIKDNIKARMNIALFCQCRNMKLVYVGSWATKTKVSFVLDNNVQFLIYQ